MDTVATWTLDELVRRVGEALAEAASAGEYPGAPNARTRDLPDRRAIRWYATIGLLDRPVAGPGRAVLYGPRQLTQLVAIKRRQAQGRSLAEIQAELAGASDATLGQIARVPPALLAARSPVAQSPADQSLADQSLAVRARFWAAPPAEQRYDSRRPEAGAAVAGGDTAIGTDADTDGKAHLDGKAHPAGPAPPAGLLLGVPLGTGASLLLSVAPDADGRPGVPLATDDLAAIAAAARPLLDLLAARGLLPTTPTRQDTKE